MLYPQYERLTKEVGFVAVLVWQTEKEWLARPEMISAADRKMNRG